MDSAQIVWYLVILTVGIALVFDLINGFHDAANSIATVVSTRVLSPFQAVLWAAFFNFVAAFLFGTKVAETISGKLIHVDLLGDAHQRVTVIFAGLLAAIVWNIITWLLALPTSSSHALMGGFAGAAVAKAGLVVIQPAGWALVALGIFFSPVFGFLLGAFNMVVVSWLFRKATPHKVDKLFRRLQLVSAGVYSLGHGGNDAQKTMGIIVALLSAAGLASYTVPDQHSWLNSFNLFGHEHKVAWWIILTCHAAIALGTMFGGWRIVKPWAPPSPGSNPSAASAPKPPPPSPSSALPSSAACPSPPPMPSPAPSWASAPPRASGPFAGSGASASSWRGFSRSPARLSSRRFSI
jgi:inorganic phosphate transporter, PiT family